MNLKLALSLLLCLVPADLLAATRPFDAEIKNNSLAISPDEQLAAVSYSDQPILVVYGLGLDRAVHTIPGFVTPRNLVFSPDGTRLYASDSTLGEIVELETQTFSVVHRFVVGAGAFGTALSRNGRTLYVNNEATSTVTRIDLPTGAITAVLTGFAQPRQGVRLSADGKTLFVTNFTSDEVIAIDTATFKITGKIAGFSQIRAISLTRDGRLLYAANSRTNTVAVVDLATDRIVASIPVGQDPYGATLAVDERHLLSASKKDGTLDVIDLQQRRITESIPGFSEPRQGLVYGHSPQIAYVLNKDLSLSVVDLVAGRVSRTLHPDTRN